MFNLKHIKIIKGVERSQNHYSFVGIKKNEMGQLEFWLPYGFDDFPSNSFNHIKQIFFDMYKVFDRFANSLNNDLKQKLDKRPASRDQVRFNKGYKFKNKNNEEVIIYSKIRMIDEILSSYDELAIVSLHVRNRRSINIDYSKIHKYLDRAIFDEDILFLDEMSLPKAALSSISSDITQLYSFIYAEIKTELKENISEFAKVLAQQFRESHLSPNQSLFDEYSFEETLLILRDVLDKIDRHTSYKDEDFWIFFNAVEKFLYGELDLDGDSSDEYWGISEFSSIWEDMCNAYEFLNDREEILFADTHIFINGEPVANTQLNKHYVFIKTGFDNPFILEYENTKRYLRPDIIKSNQSNSPEDIFNRVIRCEWPSNMTLQFYIGDAENKNTEDKKLFNIFLEKIKNLSNKNGGRLREIKKGVYKASPTQKGDFANIKKTIIDGITVMGEDFHLLDYKYYPIQKFQSKNLDEKSFYDIKKQLIYEYCLQLTKKNANTQSFFVIPWFYDSNKELEIADESSLNPDLRNSSIKIIKANFSSMKKAYLELQ